VYATHAAPRLRFHLVLTGMGLVLVSLIKSWAAIPRTAVSNTMPEFAPSFVLLQQEGFLVRSCLSTGLTALRNASPQTKEHYYTAFFQLSVGFERLMKLILILDHMAEHALTPPARNMLKAWGHDLAALLRHLCSRPFRFSNDLVQMMKAGSLELEVVEFLTGFGNSARYYNLDALSSGQPHGDPLSRWDHIAQRILAEDVGNKYQDRARRSSAALAAALKDFTLFRGFDLERKPISLEQALPLERLHQMAAPYAVLRLMGILAHLKAMLGESSDRAQKVNHAMPSTGAVIPNMVEFLDFVTDERQAVLRKKRWP